MSITIEAIAKICHEANKALCESNKDFSQVAWQVAPDWQRGSAVRGVQFHIDNPEATPESSHINWLKEKEVTGWQYGKKKDEKLKLHPCYVDYSELPESQKVKDMLFMAICDALRPFAVVGTSVEDDLPFNDESDKVDMDEADEKVNEADRAALDLDESGD